MAWVRKVKGVEELVIATDSRLRFWCSWDSCHKITTFSRGDAAMCFAGDTQYAYPMMQQVWNAIETFHKSKTRASDLTDLRGHILRVVTSMRRHIHDNPIGLKKSRIPETEFILAGFSWKTQEFHVWEIFFNATTNAFEHRTQPTIKGNRIAVIWDGKAATRKCIHDLLVMNGKQEGEMDMEPLEILRDACRDKGNRLVWWSPQMVKVYKYMSTMPFWMFWTNENDEKEITFMGRPLMEYESIPYLIMDPDTMECKQMNVANGEISRKHDDGRVER